jgi:hypothetical protein
VKIGDLIEHNLGHRGIVTDIRMMYPRHPSSPVDTIKVAWIDSQPDWAHPDLWFPVIAIKGVLSRASR